MTTTAILPRIYLSHLPELAQLRRQTQRATTKSPETSEQRDFVTNWRAPSIG